MNTNDSTIILYSIIIAVVIVNACLYLRIRTALIKVEGIKRDSIYITHLEQENKRMVQMLKRQNIYLENDNNNITG